MKKMMFNDRYGLTQAVISGRKTVTRRIVDPQGKYEELRWWQPCLEFEECMYGYTENGGWEVIEPRYNVGEIVAVAQCYMDLGYSGTALDRDPKDIMNVRGTLKQSAGWNNKMFVRAEACKHQIQITDIRIERLQDISEEDCMKEGIYRDYADTEFPPREFYDYDGNNGNGFNTPRAAFASLIDKVSGKGTWDRNPFVWRIEFQLVK